MIIILSGPSGSGKTSACAAVERLARDRGLRAGGVLCRAVFEGGRKAGIDARDLSCGPEAPEEPLARARPGAEAPPPTAGRRVPSFDDSDARVLRYGMWEFDKAALARADRAGMRGLAPPEPGEALGGRIVVIDELGPLELDYSAGMTGTLGALDREASVDGGRRVRCIVVARPDIADRLMTRWSGAARIDMAGRQPEEAARAALEALDRGLIGSRLS